MFEPVQTTSPEPETCRVDSRAGSECRCCCGSLLAVLKDGFVEVKCRRCKRIARIPLQEGRAPT